MFVSEVETPPQYTEPTWSGLVQTARFGWSEINRSAAVATGARSSQGAVHSGGRAWSLHLHPWDLSMG